MGAVAGRTFLPEWRDDSIFFGRSDINRVLWKIEGYECQAIHLSFSLEIVGSIERYSGKEGCGQEHA